MPRETQASLSSTTRSRIWESPKANLLTQTCNDLRRLDSGLALLTNKVGSEGPDIASKTVMEHIVHLDLPAFVENYRKKTFDSSSTKYLLIFSDFLVSQTVLQIFEPCHIFNCKVEPLA